MSEAVCQKYDFIIHYHIANIEYQSSCPDFAYGASVHLLEGAADAGMGLVQQQLQRDQLFDDCSYEQP